MGKKAQKRLRRLVRENERLTQLEMFLKRETGQVLEYDPAKAPHPENWLEYSEGERIQLVTEYHKKAREPFGEDEGGERLHCAFQVVVENQLAMEVPEAVEKFNSFVSGGVPRHEALHELMRDLSTEVWKRLQK